MTSTTTPPEGWIRVPVDEIAQVQGGIQKQPKRRPVLNHYPFLRVANVFRDRLDLNEVHEVELFGGELDKYRLQPGDLLVVEGNGSADQIGRSARWTGEIADCVHQNHLIRVRPGPTIDSHYLNYFWNSPDNIDHLKAVSSSTSGLYVLSGSKVKRVEVFVPPLVEQRRIVAAIEEHLSHLDAGVEALGEVRRKLERMRQTVLQTMVEGRLVRQEQADEPAELLLKRILEERRRRWSGLPRRVYQEPQAPNLSNVELEIPPSWTVASLEALTDPIRVICYGILMPKEDVPDGVPYVRVKDIQRGMIDVAGLRRTSKDIAQKYARASLQGGDVLVSIRGTYGRVAQVPDVLEGANVTQDTARIAALPGVLSSFLRLYLSSPMAKRYYDRVARGVAVKGVNIGDLRLIPVPLPSTTEQERIVAEVERIETLICDAELIVGAAIKHGNTLRRSILNAAFSGRLLPRDTDDEPAPTSFQSTASSFEVSRFHRRADRG